MATRRAAGAARDGRGHRASVLTLVLAAVVLAVELAAANAAFATLTLSTDPSDRADGAYTRLLVCAGVLAVVALVYVFLLRARTAGVLMAAASVGTAFGLWTWLLTLPLAVAAVVLSFVPRRETKPDSAALRGET